MASNTLLEVLLGGKKIFMSWNGIYVCTVRPWEARFLGNEKTRAAQNRVTWGQYYVIQCSKFKKSCIWRLVLYNRCVVYLKCNLRCTNFVYLKEGVCILTKTRYKFGPSQCIRNAQIHRMRTFRWTKLFLAWAYSLYKEASYYVP